MCIVASPARDSLGLILTLDTIADTNNSLNLSQSAVNWFKHARFDQIIFGQMYFFTRYFSQTTDIFDQNILIYKSIP